MEDEPVPSSMDLGSTAYLLTLKGSLVSVLSYSETSDLYSTLMVSASLFLLLFLLMSSPT